MDIGDNVPLVKPSAEASTIHIRLAYLGEQEFHKLELTPKANLLAPHLAVPLTEPPLADSIAQAAYQILQNSPLPGPAIHS